MRRLQPWMAKLRGRAEQAYQEFLGSGQAMACPSHGEPPWLGDHRNVQVSKRTLTTRGRGEKHGSAGWEVARKHVAGGDILASRFSCSKTHLRGPAPPLAVARTMR